MTNNTTAETVRRLRSERDFTQADIAARMSERGHGWYAQTVQKIESYGRPLRLDEAVSLSEILRVPLDRVAGVSAPAPMSQTDIAREIQRLAGMLAHAQA